MLSFGEAMRSVGAGAELLVERLRSGVSYNPLSSRTAQDPYPVYAALRARDPVHRSRLLKAWLFTRHGDVAAILSDHRHFGNDPRTGTLTSRQHATRRDWAALGGSEADVIPLGKFRQGAEIPQAAGILFATYATLRSPARQGKRSRLEQIVG